MQSLAFIVVKSLKIAYNIFITLNEIVLIFTDQKLGKFNG
ncbi:hypothetical protein RT41_GL000994 [Lactococcus fujiensis JCM 16395]|uniref:Uncharacterized protein n=1 Tax=Lactococcus fujiensis JCM 16395 TaxID=1291764 RepID=A0A2A5RMN7_9LACT|nr:hypothetical protein RT41_GL000994 [Lactococcus fujiensis JCM 16395]